MTSLLLAQIILLVVAILAATGLVAQGIIWLEKKDDRGEGWLKKFLRLDAVRDMSGVEYLLTLLGVSVGVGVWIFLAGLAQGFWCGGVHGLTLLQAAHLGVSVATHTNWQPWAPEIFLSPWTQIIAVGLGNLLIGAVCIAAWRALTRALARKGLGNAWAGVYRGVLILLPLQIILALLLAGQGVNGWVANFCAGALVSGAGAGWMADSFASAVQNPTAISDFASVVMLVSVPMAFLWATGVLTKREGLIGRLTLAIFLLLAAATAVTLVNNPNHSDTPRWAVNEALWLNATAGSANGTVNASLENFRPAGVLPPFLILLGGVPLPPAVGLGVGVLLMFLLIAIYLASLMAGRSPDFLGFKVRLSEVAVVACGVLGPQLVILGAVVALVGTPEVLEILKTQGAHGMSALLWAVGSWAQNNGSAYPLDLTQPIFIHASMIVMTLGRLLTLGAVVLFAALLAGQRSETPSAPAVNPQSGVMLSFWVAVIIVGAVLAMLPLLLMGPVVEGLK